MSADPTPRFVLRQLPLPAKLVISCFLLAVGLGYSSAMVQLHMQHSERDGNHLPTVENVVAVFAGKAWKKPGDTKSLSRLESIINGQLKGGLTGANMAPAFLEKSADFKSLPKERLAEIEAERDGERHAVIAWINSPPDVRKKAYEEDKFRLPGEHHNKPLTPEFSKDLNSVPIKTILDKRCAECHAPGKDKDDIPLTTYEELAKFMPATVEEVPPGGGWVSSGKQMSLEKLTQSTHAHLLSFAVLFALTGLTFAFTSYPGVVRGVVGPVVLVAQVADVSCWWLARIPDVGPTFAMAIIGTGGIVGLGLGAQIVLSLFNMYGPKGKTVLLLLFAGAGAAGGFAYKELIDPYLKGEKEQATARATGTQKKADDVKGKAPAPDKPAPKAEGNPATPPATSTGPSKLEKLVTGPFVPKKGPWTGKKDGGMVRAFFDKDEGAFETAQEEKSPDLTRLQQEREGEQAAVLAWLKAAPDARKKAYETDQLPLPQELAGKPFTAEFKAGDKAVKVKSLFDARCARCHKPGGDKEDAPLHTFEAIEKYLKPASVAAAPPAVQEKPAAAPIATAAPLKTDTAPVPVSANTEPIPAAKD